MDYLQLVVILFTLVIMILFILKQCNKKYIPIIISVNVHENLPFLQKQLYNFHQYMKSPYIVILNCNDYMFNECKNTILPDNVFVHPTPLNKKWFHGSVSQGIYNNMKWSIENYRFTMFLVASSRTIFGNPFKNQELSPYFENDQELKPHSKQLDNCESASHWHWPIFCQSNLASYFMSQKKSLYGCAHEGIGFSYKGCKKIVKFLENHSDLQDFFNLEIPVEEIALQTISINLKCPIYYIGNGCCNEDPVPPNEPNEENKKFMYKVKRE
jgi:hypothetical protein